VCAGPTDEVHRAVADLEVQAVLERRRGQALLDLLEVEAAHRALGELVERRTQIELVEQAVDEGGRDGGHLGRRGCGRVQIRRVREQLVAEAVIAVGVRVHRLLDGVALGDRPHRVEHAPREPQVEQRVDEHRRAVAGDEAGVAPAPAAVRLEVGEEPVAELVQALGVRDVHGAERQA